MTTSQTTIPLTVVESAIRVTHQYPGWAESLVALDRMRKTLDLSSAHDALIATCAVCSLLDVPLNDIIGSAARLHKAFVAWDRSDHVSLVYRIGATARGGWQGSFASKAVHFLISPEAVPPFDSLADGAVQLLSGAQRPACNNYSEFKRRVDRMRGESPSATSYRHIDHVLWISAKYRSWERERSKRARAASLFESPSEDLRKVLEWYASAADSRVVNGVIQSR